MRRFLSLAAMPTFAIMALLSVLPDRMMPSALCALPFDASWLTGMGTMYALMSAFHSGPWLELFEETGRVRR